MAGRPRARAAQREVLTRLAFKGAPIEPEHAYYRVFNGFATALDARSLAIVVRDPDVKGVFPVRAAIPAAVDPDSVDDLLGVAGGRRPDVGIPGFSGAGVTVALLDTGVDLVHPYIRGSLIRGFDVLDPGGNASARQNPTAPGRPERHGTEMAGLVVGSDGPDGLEGVAPGASLLPIRVAGWQPDTSGGVSVYGRTDQLLAGLELAVDPNEDGDAHDAARIALVGVVEPFAAFTDGPLAARGGRCVRARLARGRPRRQRRAGRPCLRQHRRPGRCARGAHRGRDRHATPEPDRPCPPARRASCPRLRRPAARRRRGSLHLGVGTGRRARAVCARGGRCGGRIHAPLRHERVQPRRRFRGAASARHIVPRGGSGGRRCRCARCARRRAVAGRLARHRRPRRRADPRAGAGRCERRPHVAPALDSGRIRCWGRGLRPERGPRWCSAILVRGPRIRRRAEARGKRGRDRPRDVRPWAKPGWRRALRNAERLQRLGCTHGRCCGIARSGPARS